MKVRDLYDPAFFMSKSLPPKDREPATHVQVLRSKPAELKLDTSQEFNTDREAAAQIVTVWRNTMGMELNVETVQAHLETLKRWHSRLESWK